MRDAFVAALTLNIFHRHVDRIKMANIAQVVNVLQSMILTDMKENGHMVLTPTYHVFRMYQPFQDATALPVEISCDSIKVRENQTIPTIFSSAAETKDNSIVISLANISLDKSQDIDIVSDLSTINNITGEILKCKNISDYNDFEHPQTITPHVFKDMKIKKNIIKIKIPAKSIVVLNIK